MPYSRVGGKYFYRECDVAAYLESKTRRVADSPASGTEPAAIIGRLKQE